MTLTRQAEKAKVRMRSRLEADVMTGALAGHMLSMARTVTADPAAFNEHHAAKLRDAAQLACDAAALIDMERKNERRTRHTG